MICVDDGSTDAGAAVASRQDGGGRADQPHPAGQPRRRAGPQRGVRRASGRYLAFVDGDDMVPRRAFQRLVASLEITGSDLACGNVMRLHRNLLVPSWAHKEAFAESRNRTHITRHPLLIRDRMLWNKVYRRRFWNALGLSLPRADVRGPAGRHGRPRGRGAVDVIKGSSITGGSATRRAPRSPSAVWSRTICATACCRCWRRPRC